MGQRVLFNGKIYTEPTVQSRIISGVQNGGAPASFGNICIIDTGLGAGYGGGKGILGTGSVIRQQSDFLNTFTSSAEMKNFVKGGAVWDLADYVYNPSTSAPGASIVYMIRAALTTIGTKTMTFTDTNALVINTQEEGLVVNGVLNSTYLAKGYAMTLEAGVIDTAKFIIKFWRGAYRGADTNGYLFDGIAEADAAKNPILITQTTEFTTFAQFYTWAAGDTMFQKYFAVDSTSDVAGTIVTADLTLLSGFQLFAGGTETYSSTALDTVLDNIKELDNSFFLALDNDGDADGTSNVKILAHITNEAAFKKFIIIGGGNDSTKFSQSGGSFDSAATLNSRYAILCHSGLEVPYILNQQIMVKKSSVYLAALVTGRAAGLEPQTPLTFKNLRITKLQHTITDKITRERAIDAGVITIRPVPGIGLVVNQGINTMQLNNFLYNPDGTSPEISIERIEAQLNREISEDGLTLFPGGNSFSVTANDLVQFTNKKLKSKMVKPGIQDGLIIDFANVKAVRSGTTWNVSYDFVPNSPVNKVFSTGTIIDPTIS